MFNDVCKWLTYLGLLASLTLAIVVLNKVEKNCCKQNYTYTRPRGVHERQEEFEL